MDKKSVTRVLEQSLDQAVSVSTAEVAKFVQRVRARNPQMSDRDLVKGLERSYLGLVTGTGAVAGGAAAAPGVGLAPGLVAAAADVAAFTTATATYTLAVASVHGVEVTDIEQRKALVMAALAGPQGPKLIQKAAGRTGAHWGRQVTGTVPVTTLRQINKVLGRNFVTKYGTKQGVIVLGKVVPFGIGAGIGGAANYTLARMVIRTVASAFPETLHKNSEQHVTVIN